MLKLHYLLLSCFASGFGLCSFILAFLTVFHEFNFASLLRLFLTLVFLGINLAFALHYYSLLLKELNFRKNRARVQKMHSKV